MDRLSHIQLKQFLRERNLDTTGSKNVLISRLTEALGNENIDVHKFVIDKIGEPSHRETRSMIGVSGQPHHTISGNLPGAEESADVTPNESASQLGRKSVISQHTSGSSRSSRSGSSVSRQRQKAAAKKAALEAKRVKLQELEELEKAEAESKRRQEEQNFKYQQQQFKYQQQRRRIQLDTDIEMAKAEENALSEVNIDQTFDNKNAVQFLRDQKVEADPVGKWLESNDAMIKEPLQDVFNNQNLRVGPLNRGLVQGNSEFNESNLMNALVSCNLKNLMPNQKINVFDGDYTAYFLFRNSFDNVINSNLTSDRERLQYLEQFTRGRPNEIVRACLHLPPSEGYKRARESLDARYGNPNRVVQAFVERILNWKNIRRDDTEELDEYAIMLSSCQNAVSGVPHGSAILNNPETMRRILNKIPITIQDRSRRLADDIMHVKGREINFDDLVKFIEREARIMKNPYFGKQSFGSQENTRQPESRNRNAREDNSKPGYRNEFSSRDRQLNVNSIKTGLSCWFCGGAHLLDDCEEVGKMSHDDKLEAIKKLNLCFSCLRGGHTSRCCISRKTCSICGQSHPELLHKQVQTSTDRPEEENITRSCGDEAGPKEVAIYMNRGGGNCKGMSVVPVKVKGLEGHEVETMAFLDGGCSGSFCTAGLMEKLGMSAGSCDKMGVTTTTMHGSKRDVYSILPGLVVSDLQKTNSISLPPVYVTDTIPIERCDVVNKSDLVRWPHLEGLDLPFSSADVELMIGNNVPHVLEPWEVINSRNDFEPHAIRTRLGWVVCGAVSGNNHRVSINRISIGRGIKLDKLMIEEYNRDFQDLASSKKELSVEDIKWLDTADRGCRMVEGKYEIPLPLCSDIADLPCSKPAALKRLQGLRRKLMKDSEYAMQYCKFMDDMLANNYAEKIKHDIEVKQGDSWYIPHFGVTHPDKPGKVRVVFDCAAKVEGVSLNDFLIQGPDMINSLICVLLNFRVGCYAYTSDIETMFYQVRVPPRDRDYLRFLWWDKNDFSSEPSDFRMCVHIFGASSSPNIANYALKRISTDMVEGFSGQSRETMRRNFYVDDLLRSEDTTELLVDNATEVSELCRLGGFNLTKFCSNNVKFLQNIRADSLHMSAIEVLKGNFGKIKALGVIWYLESDELGVSIDHLKMAGTKRELLSCIASMYDPIGLISPLVLEGRVIMQDLCRLQIDWDSCIVGEFRRRIEIWMRKIEDSKGTRITRCIKNQSI